MKHFNATDAKNRFGELLDEIASGPVTIRKNGREVAVLMSKADFEARDTRAARKEQIQRYHEESMAQFEEVYTELAK